jgi:hypothetical protein
MKLADYLEINGARKTAEKLVNIRLLNVCGMDIGTIPDSTTLWDIVEELEEILQDENYKQEDIKNILKEITFELIEEIAY